MTLEEAKQQLRKWIDDERHLYVTSTMPENQAYHLANEDAYRKALNLIRKIDAIGGDIR